MTNKQRILWGICVLFNEIREKKIYQVFKILILYEEIALGIIFGKKEDNLVKQFSTYLSYNLFRISIK